MEGEVLDEARKVWNELLDDIRTATKTEGLILPKTFPP